MEGNVIGSRYINSSWPVSTGYSVFMVSLIFLRDGLAVAIVKTDYGDSNFQYCDLSIYGTKMVLTAPYSVDMIFKLLK